MDEGIIKRLRYLAQNTGDFETRTLSEAADRIEALEAWLEQRDAFIVSKDLWHEFVSTMPMKTKPIMENGRITGYVADFSDFFGKLTGKKKDG